MAWNLQFLGYLRTLSLKFQNATTEIDVFPDPAMLAVSANLGPQLLQKLRPLRHLDTKLGETPNVGSAVKHFCSKEYELVLGRFGKGQ